MINEEKRVYCLYGFPVTHSLSPIIFNRTFEKMGLNGTYVTFSIRPENLKESLEAARVLGFDGFNVTMPHKTRIIELLDGVEKQAGEIGSVNTVARDSQGLVGYNTDGQGAVRAMEAHGFDPRGQTILLLGAGGAARAIARTLPQEAEITILSRNPERAADIVDGMPGRRRMSSGLLTKQSFEEFVSSANLLANATPVQTVGLIRALGSSTAKLHSELWVFDLAYDQPLEKLPNGLKRISPLEMLVHQAALSYEIWTHQPPPFQLMRSILVEHVGRDWK